MQLLKEVEDIDADWLTAALREGGSLGEGKVTSVKVERIAVGVGLLGRLARLTVEYEGASSDAPATMVFKYPIDLPPNRELADAYRFYKRECDFYAHVAGQSPLRTPKIYFNQYDENLDFILLQEDLGAARPGDQIAGNRAEDATHAIVELAKHHAQFWGKTEGMDFLVEIDDPVVCHVLSESCTAACPVMLETYSDLFSPELAKLASSVVERIPGGLKAAGNHVATVCHGDFRADNMFFEGLPGGDKLAIIDWQICSRGAGPFDVAYHLTQSVTPEVRREIERPTLKAYHKTLVDNGVKDYSFEELFEDYREAALFALVYPITVCGALDLTNDVAKQLGQVFIERSLSAITDLKAGEKLSLWD